MDLKTDRRHQERTFQSRSLTATFNLGGSEYRAQLRDISANGIGLTIDHVPEDWSSLPDEVIQLNISTEDGSTLQEARIAWGRCEDSAYIFGCAFTGSPEKSPRLDMSLVKIDPNWALKVPATFAIRREVIPFAEVDGCIYVATAEKPDDTVKNLLNRYLKRDLKFELAEPRSLRSAITRVFASRISEDKRSEEDPVRLSNDILHAAILRQASDVHLNPEKDRFRIRFRVDGKLEEFCDYSKEVQASLLSRFKVLSGMDISEKRAPQDGRFTHQIGDKQSVNIRAATIPSKFGERMTLRLLAVETEFLTHENLGMDVLHRQLFERMLERPYGLMLITGPTGSGKTTTLYAAIRRLLELLDPNIITIEDPVEYQIPGVTQVEMGGEDKVNFVKALRSTLRHDPDVVMIGEIRDRETADIALKAALTGHLVLSTLHTNTAMGAVTRLKDMGVEPYLIAATLKLTVAQRLVRKLCSHCRTSRPMHESERAAFHLNEERECDIYEANACVYCAHKGYAGRLGVFEMFDIDDETSRLIAQGADEADLVDHAKKRSLPFLYEDGRDKLQRGLTSYSEISQRVLT